MWKLRDDGTREFLGGRDDGEVAARAAETCGAFREDVEEEIVADEIRSCYNCRFRRWTVESFVCLHRAVPGE